MSRGGPHTRPNRGSIADRTLDLLQIDGGWLTTQGIARDLGEKPKTIERTLARLRQRGWVSFRPRDRGLEWRTP